MPSGHKSYLCFQIDGIFAKLMTKAVFAMGRSHDSVWLMDFIGNIIGRKRPYGRVSISGKSCHWFLLTIHFL